MRSRGAPTTSCPTALRRDSRGGVATVAIYSQGVRTPSSETCTHGDERARRSLWKCCPPVRDRFTLTDMSAPTTRYVDHAAEGTAVGRCVVLPGRQYTAEGPLLYFAAQAALMRGWNVRQVWWEAAERGSLVTADEMDWVGDQMDAALSGYTGRVLIVAKSLGTLAATRAAAKGYDAAWLTPLLAEPDAAEPLLSYPASQFVVIGSSDPYLSRDVLEVLPGTSLVVPGDHILRVHGDPVAGVASHEQFVQAFDAWLEGLQR